MNKIMTIGGICLLIGLIMMLGAVGAADTDTLSLSGLVIRAIVSIILMLIGCCLLQGGNDND